MCVYFHVCTCSYLDAFTRPLLSEIEYWFNPTHFQSLQNLSLECIEFLWALFGGTCGQHLVKSALSQGGTWEQLFTVWIFSACYFRHLPFILIFILFKF